MKRFILFTAAILLAGSGLWFFAMAPAPEPGLRLGNNPKLPTLTFYTSGLATTPQMPLWYAARKGGLLAHCNIEVKVWKNLDDLRGTMLAGKGDLWLGNTDGFLLSAMRGAPVKLLAVTAWRKFYLVSTDATRLRIRDHRGETLACAPVGSPAVPVLNAIFKGEEAIAFAPGEPRQIAMRLMQGEITAALVPEPLVSMLEKKVEGLKVGESVESLYGEATHQKPRMPIAGIAINTKSLERYPGLADIILSELKQAGEVLAKDPDAGIEVLPEAFAAFIAPGVVAASLKRDAVVVESARKSQGELTAYLKMILTDREISSCDIAPYLY